MTGWPPPSPTPPTTWATPSAWSDGADRAGEHARPTPPRRAPGLVALAVVGSMVGLLAFSGGAFHLANRVQATAGGLSEEAAEIASREAVELGWPVIDGAEVSLASGRGDCVEGWLDGAVDRHRVRHEWARAYASGSLILSFTTYASESDAAADLARARTDEYLACQERFEPDDDRAVTEAKAYRLAPDHEVPGIGFVINVFGGGEWAPSYEFVVVVGRMRAHVDLCACPAMTFDDQREVAVAAAAAMAEVQGLPTPGG